MSTASLLTFCLPVISLHSSVQPLSSRKGYGKQRHGVRDWMAENGLMAVGEYSTSGKALFMVLIVFLIT